MKKSDFCNNISIVTIYNDFSGYHVVDTTTNVQCPLHEERTGSMKLYINNNKFKCFGCGFYGGPIDFIMELKNVSCSEAINILCEKYGYIPEPSKIQDVDAYEKAVEFHRIMELAANKFAANYTDYWSKRGISDTVIAAYKLGYAPKDLYFDARKSPINNFEKIGLCTNKGTSAYAGRYIIPIKDKSGFVTGFAGRASKCDDIKYINSKECAYFNKSELLYNFDVAKTASSIIVVEGYMDALSLITAGITNVVATMGTTLTEQHINMLQGKEIILGFDSDDAGKNATLRTISKYPKIKFKVIKPLKVKDFNELLLSNGVESLRSAVNNLTDGIDFILENIQYNNDLSDVETQDKLWRFLAGIIGALELPYQEKYPMNIIYTPVAIRRWWHKFYNIIEGGESVDMERI